MRLRRSALALVMVCACGDDAPIPPAPPPACEPPKELVGGECREPDQPQGCAPGELELSNGDCSPAGIAVCGEGFTYDGDRGCEPVLPAEPCPFGQMAVPGERACRAVMDCPGGRWGEIPVGDDTVYVDDSYAGGDGDGSEDKPFPTISEAVLVATSGAVIAIAAGSYAEEVAIYDPVSLWGVCPQESVLTGGNSELPDIGIFDAVGTEIHGLGLAGGAGGIGINDGAEVLVERVWIHEHLTYGVLVYAETSPASLRIRDSLIEQTRDHALLLLDADGTLERSVVRDTTPAEGDILGALGPGRGVAVESSGLGERPSLAIDQSVIERSTEAGAAAVAGELVIAGSVIRDTRVDAQGNAGRGISVQQLTLDRPARLALSASLVEGSREVGVFAHGAELAIEATVIRDTTADDNEKGGYAISVQHPVGAPPVPITVASCLVDGAVLAGILVAGATAGIEQCLVRNVTPAAGDLYGDGVVALFLGTPAQVALGSSRIESPARAGIASFGSIVSLQASAIACAAFDFDSEQFVAEASVLDESNNGCGCPDPVLACKSISTGVAPPNPPSP